MRHLLQTMNRRRHYRRRRCFRPRIPLRPCRSSSSRPRRRGTRRGPRQSPWHGRIRSPTSRRARGRTPRPCGEPMPSRRRRPSRTTLATPCPARPMSRPACRLRAARSRRPCDGSSPPTGSHGSPGRARARCRLRSCRAGCLASRCGPQARAARCERPPRAASCRCRTRPSILHRTWKSRWRSPDRAGIPRREASESSRRRSRRGLPSLQSRRACASHSATTSRRHPRRARPRVSWPLRHRPARRGRRARTAAQGRRTGQPAAAGRDRRAAGC